MLRARKHLTRHELRRDALLEFLYSARKFFERNRKRILIWGGGAVGAGLLVATVMIWRTGDEREAWTLFEEAALDLDAGRTHQAEEKLLRLKEELGSTEAGGESRALLGQSLLEKKQAAEAESEFLAHLKRGEDPYLLTGSLEELAAVALQSSRYLDAAKYYRQAASISDSKFHATWNHLRSIDCLIQAGSLAEARSQVDRLEAQEEFPSLLKDDLAALQGRLAVAESKGATPRVPN